MARLVALGIGSLRARRQELIRARGSERGEGHNADALGVLNKALSIHIRRMENLLRHDPPTHWETVLGPRPDSPRDRAKWDTAIRSSARHLVVHGVERHSRADGIEALLGERPMRESAARSWDRAASQIEHVAAQSVGVGRLELDVGVEL